MMLYLFEVRREKFSDRFTVGFLKRKNDERGENTLFFYQEFGNAGFFVDPKRFKRVEMVKSLTLVHPFAGYAMSDELWFAGRVGKQ